MGDGAPIGFAMLGVMAASFYGAATSTLDDFFVWVFGADLLKLIGMWLGVIAVVVVLILVQKLKSTAGAHGHITYAEGTDQGLASLTKHEEAHQRVTRAVGGGGSTVSIWRTSDGGWAGKCTFHDPARVAALEPEKKIAISLAGIIAAPDTTSPTDKPHAKAYSREADNPSQAMRDGKKIACKIL